jgi:phosphoglycerate dehydrogenase-like enzyme
MKGEVSVMEKYKVLFWDVLPSTIIDILKSIMPDDFELVIMEKGDDEERIRKAKEADFIFSASSKVEKKYFLEAKKLKMIQQQGVGYDNAKVDELTELGIPLCLMPAGTTGPVSEHAILLILAVNKKLVFMQNAMRKGLFFQFEYRHACHNLEGMTVGIVGFGRIGQMVAKKLNAFDTKVICYDSIVKLSVEKQKELNVTQLDDLDDIFRRSDIVTLHIPLTAESRKIVDAHRLSLMKPTAVLINTARGPVVDEAALIDALKRGVIAGAGLDVFEKEPINKDNPLLTMDNVVMTPHVSAATKEAYITKVMGGFSNYRKILNKEVPNDCLNPDVLKK